MSEDRFRLDDDDFEDQSGNGDGNGGSHDPEDYASPEMFEADKYNLEDFLKYPVEKRKLTDFLEDTTKQYEQEAVDRMIARVNHEHESDLQGATPFHKPGHIGPLMYEYLNMIGVESSFISGLQHTKSSMTKAVQQKVDQINTLLRGVGGFNRQIKASFSRAASLYLEQEDPENPHRENVIFTVNLANFELRYPMGEEASAEVGPDGRTQKQMVWDEAVNTLCEIVSNTGMKPKFVKNDKASTAFTLKQYLLDRDDKGPDEYFMFDLRHINENVRQEMIEKYEAKVDAYKAKIEKIMKKMNSPFTSRKRFNSLQQKLFKAEKQKDFYIGTTPDPRELDAGLVFSIKVNTLKDYTVTKDKMQVIMTKYILALSKIAVDKSMDQQVNTVYHRSKGRPKDFQALSEGPADDSTYTGKKAG